MKKLNLIICLTLVSGFAFSQWIQITPELPNPQLQLKSIFFTDANTGYIACIGGIIKTIDGGETWNELYGGSFNSICFTDTNIGFAVGGYGKIIKTIDGGELWIELSSGTTSELKSVYFTDSIRGFAVGDNNPGQAIMIKTIDGGETWASLSFTITDVLNSVYFTDKNTGYAVGGHFSSHQGIILKTIDGGETWSPLILEELYRLNSVFFPESNIGYAAGGWHSQGIIIKTSDGGKSWNILLSQIPELNSVFFIDIKTGFAVGGYDNKIRGIEEQIILKTTDGGTTWDELKRGTTEPLNAVFFTDASTGFVVGDGGIILKTTNGGGFPTVVENVSQESTFTVYPNPATNKISFENHSNLQGETTICIYNMNGAILQQEKFQNQTLIEMDVSAMAKGIYLLKIQTKWGVETKKLVVQ